MAVANVIDDWRPVAYPWGQDPYVITTTTRDAPPREIELRASALDLLVALEGYAGKYQEGDVFAGRVRDAMRKLQGELAR